MEQSQTTQITGFLKSLRENWFLILFVGGLIVTWNNYSNRLNIVETAQADNKAQIKNTSDQVTVLSNNIIEIKAQYIYIKESLVELKDKK